MHGARVHGDRHADAGVGARELLEHEDVGEEVGAGTAELLGHADAHQARARRASRTARVGKRCSRSHAAACGSISACANSRASAWISRWSAVREKSIGPSLSPRRRRTDFVLNQHKRSASPHRSVGANELVLIQHKLYAAARNSRRISCRTCSRSQNASTTSGSNCLPARRRSPRRQSRQLARLAVRPVVRDRVERVRDGEDPRAERDLLADEPVRIAAAVPALVVRADDLDAGPVQEGDAADHLRAEQGVRLHQRATRPRSAARA